LSFAAHVLKDEHDVLLKLREEPDRLVLWDLRVLGDGPRRAVNGTFVQIAPVALPTAQETVRGTVITAVYALDSLGNVGKLMDHLGQK
jgi:hypothetical protein